ncbi:MAG: ABC-type transport auxiliary lipoprotein family protein [Alphaproteobacteria bacterium]|nr:ABC-type transport auxiliary lipoprotein family protein [Alphaproteobacteria bacterium]
MKIFKSHFLKGFLSIGPAFFLAGCSSLFPLFGNGGVPPVTYDLRAASLARTGANLNVKIAIRRPHAIQVLNGVRILFRPSEQIVGYFSAAQWSDRLPNLIQDHLLRSFEEDQSMDSVSRFSDSFSVDYEFFSDIRDFSILDFQEGKIAYVNIYVRLAKKKSDNSVFGRSFRAEVPVIEGEFDMSISALDHAFSQVLSEILFWTVNMIDLTHEARVSG